MKKITEISIILVFICFFSACSKKNEKYIIPENYSADAVVKVYNDKIENTYNLKIACKNGNYSLWINDGESNWSISTENDTCVLSNDKFLDCSINISDLKIKNSMLSDFNLTRFKNSLDPVPKEIIYWDGTYKHILNFSKENLLPNNIFIYKNDILVKAIQYNEINIE